LVLKWLVWCEHAGGASIVETENLIGEVYDAAVNQLGEDATEHNVDNMARAMTSELERAIAYRVACRVSAEESDGGLAPLREEEVDNPADNAEDNEQPMDAESQWSRGVAVDGAVWQPNESDFLDVEEQVCAL
jgi:hypothetical protein